LIFDPESKQSQPQVEQISSQTNLSTIESFSPQYFSLEKTDFITNISSNTSMIVNTTYSVIYIGGIIFLTSLIVMVMLPQISTRAKTTALLLFAAAFTIVLLGGISYYNLGDEANSSLFGLQGYGIILVGLLLFVITAPFVHSNIANLTNVYIFGLSVLAILSVYFLAGNTNMSTDPTLYQSQIITELQIGDLSQVAYGEPVRHFNPSIPSVSQIAYSAFVIFLFQFFVFIAMRQENRFNRFAPFMYIVICAGLLWSAMFYAVGYPLYKIVVILIIGLPITPLVWQFFGVYLKKLARDRQLSQWTEEGK
jgi:hypothetical protein